jgi:hypothetical protein
VDHVPDAGRLAESRVTVQYCAGISLPDLLDDSLRNEVDGRGGHEISLAYDRMIVDVDGAIRCHEHGGLRK